MSHRAYTEDQLVEQPAAALLAELGWATVSAEEEAFGPGGTLGRETPGEVVLLARLRPALAKLNPKLPPEAIAAAIEELTRDRSAMGLTAANQETYKLLKDGVPVFVPDPERGGQKAERVRVVDWDHASENDFLAVRQITFTGPLYTCRPDIVGFINGLPLVVLEFKKPGVPARQAFEENLTSYKHPQNGVPALFWYNAFLIASNGTESRVGSLTADWERFTEWKRVESEDEPRRVSLETLLRGTCDPARLLDIVENFTLFSTQKAGVTKIIGQNHQVLGVNNSIQATMKARAAGHGRGGVFWQTQGSGKSYSMVFYAQKILRKYPGNWTFVVVTDRVELDLQIAKTFAACGAVTDANECHAQSGAHLRQLLGENHRYVFTLIHKFQTPDVLCDRRDVIVLTDESHRSQYDTLALNMRSALPKALFLAFTGTPLIAGEERTREVFGDYVSVYDFQQSVEDGATVPLFYENRTPELQLTNPTLNEDIYDIIEDAGLNEAQEDRLAQVLGKQYHILTRDDRLETVARDIVRHFLGRGFSGKAMVVSIDKATALRMHDKVKKHWAAEMARVETELGRFDHTPDRKNELLDLSQRLKSVDMALIVSPGQNEIEQMKKLGLDLVPHRKRMNDSQPPLDERFKDPNDPLSLVFLCAMWLTGFDAPSCSTVYLDKPMRNHTLMQTIARANRVFPGKYNGMIVDYANVFASLERALAIYGAGQGGKTPVRDKKKLVEDLRRAVTEATTFCANHDVILPTIEQLPAGGMQRLQRIDDAVNALVSPDPLRKEFLGHERIVRTLYDAVKPDPSVLEFAPRMSCLTAIAEAIRAKTNPGPVDVSQVLGQIGVVLDNSIAGVAMSETPPKQMDLSKIDFQALAGRFKQSKRKNIELEALKAAIRAMLERLIRLNRTRVDFQERFEELIEAYNAGSKNIEELFNELLKLSRALTEEETRHVRENLTEAELTVFDILTRPAPEMTPDEREQVKKVAHLLLDKLKQLLTFNWRQTTQARARVRDTIEEVLDSGLPRLYTEQIYKDKCSRLFEHVFENYRSGAESVFTGPI
jgi:type I restriction enzyme R subunit